jgi:hypothetical protein
MARCTAVAARQGSKDEQLEASVDEQHDGSVDPVEQLRPMTQESHKQACKEVIASVSAESDSGASGHPEPEPQAERLQALIDDPEAGNGLSTERPMSRTAQKKARRQRRKALAAGKSSE